MYFISLSCGIDSPSVGFVLCFSFTLYSDRLAAQDLQSFDPMRLVCVTAWEKNEDWPVKSPVPIQGNTDNKTRVCEYTEDRVGFELTGQFWSSTSLDWAATLFVNDFVFTVDWKEEIRHCFHFRCRIIHDEDRRKTGRHLIWMGHFLLFVYNSNESTN